MNVICKCCGNNAEPHKSINCCICDNSYKIECVDISNAEARKIRSKAGLTWTCKKCSTLGNDLNTLKKLIVGLQQEISDLKNTIKTASPSSHSFSPQDMETIVQEISQRDKRKTNVIVYGCKEGNYNSNKEQLKADEPIISQILSTLSVTEDELKIVRLGKFEPSNTNRGRPIKIMCSSVSNVNTILRNSYKLKTVNEFKDIRISSDKTPAQIQFFKEVKGELTRRLTAGEKDLTIKYRNGIPTIITKTSLN